MKKLTFEQAVKTPNIAFLVKPEHQEYVGKCLGILDSSFILAARTNSEGVVEGWLDNLGEYFTNNYKPILVKIIEEDSLAFNSQQEVWQWLVEGNKCLRKEQDIYGFKDGVFWNFTFNRKSFIKVSAIANWTKYKEPEYITVNGFQVPKPIKELPKDLKKNWVYAPNFTATDLVEAYDNSYCKSYLTILLEREVLHLSQEAAIIHAKAMLGIE